MSLCMTKRILGAVAALVLVVACENAGAYRTTGITATGVVRGLVFFDANGSGNFDAADSPAVGVRVRLITPFSRDTVRRVVTGADGAFRIDGVPVGSYGVVVDPTSVGDSVTVRRVTSGSVTLRPNDSVSVEAVVGFTTLTTAQVRTLAVLNGKAAVGSRVFVTGVALHASSTFSDTLLHVVDTSGALRVTRVRPSAAVAGDSVRLRGRIAVRDGQRVLDDVTVYIVGGTFIPTAPIVTSLQASNANAGALDASLVRLLDATVLDTATVRGSLNVLVNDGTGPLTVVLDRVADAGFRVPFVAAPLAIGSRYDLAGVLVPNGSGRWALRPRALLDITRR